MENKKTKNKEQINKLLEEIETSKIDAEEQGYDYLQTDEGRSKIRQLNEEEETQWVQYTWSLLELCFF